MAPYKSVYTCKYWCKNAEWQTNPTAQSSIHILERKDIKIA